MNIRTLATAAALLTSLFVAPAVAAPNTDGVFAVLDSLQGTAVEQVMSADAELGPRFQAAVEVDPADPAKVRLAGVLGALDGAEADSDALRLILTRAPITPASTSIAAR